MWWRAILADAGRGRPLLAVTALVLAMGLGVTGVASAREQSRAIHEARAAFAVPANLVGKPSPSSIQSVWVYLKSRDATGEVSTARAVSDPGGREYRHYLSPAQVRARFAPRRRTVSAVRRWLRSAGLHPGAVPANRAYVEARGSVGHLERAFGVSLGLYKVHGRRVLAAGGAPSVPSSIASSVLNVAGLNQSPMTALDTPPPPNGFRNEGPCSQFWQQQLDLTDPLVGGQAPAYLPCAYTPGQVRSAYGLDTPVGRGIDGSGQTVAIVLWYGSPTVFADASTYAQNNDPSHPLSSGQFSQQLATPNFLAGCEPSDIDVEQALDVEAVHATAPGADILYESAADCTDGALNAAENAIVADHSADIISNSWGECESQQAASDAAAFEQIAMQAAIEGIGIYASSGDAGDEVADCGAAQTDVPAADPWVTSVGGTTDGIDAAGQRVFETAWESGFSSLFGGAWSSPQFTSGSGGGTSRLFAQPAYQAGVVPDALAQANQSAGTLGRVVPDLAALADPNTGFLIGLTQTFPEGTSYDQFREGGTSVASPLVAGMMADANSLDGVDHGFVNPALYGVAKPNGGLDDVLSASESEVRRDFANGTDASLGEITTLRTFDDDSGLVIHDTAGYNDVTGLGSPDGPVLLAVHSLSLTPDATQVAPDVPVSFQARGVDGLGAGFDATQASSLSISPSAGATGASCTAGACSAASPGTYTVTATYAGNAPTVNGQTVSATARFTVLGPPSATVTTPSEHATYTLGEAVPSAYVCSDSTDAPGLVAGSAGCSATTGDGAPIDTSTLGAHTFTVTATSQDGQRTTRSVPYTVVAPATPSTPSPRGTPPRSSPAVPTSPTVSASPGKAGLTYRLSAGGSPPGASPIVRYRWTLGKRQIGSGRTILHTFPRAGHRYRVVLTVTDSAGSSSSTTITLTPRGRRATARLTLHFARDRASLDSRSERRALAQLRPMFAHALRVRIAGYCAAAEVSRSHALRLLSTERAQAVLRFLTAHHNRGAQHVTVSGEGATAFLARNRTARGRAANRRATVVIDYEKPLR
jgi:flagellar motor protein MotB